MFGFKQGLSAARRRNAWHTWPLCAALLGPCASLAAQTTDQENVSRQIQNLTDAMTRTQSRLEESQRQLDEMRKQLTALQDQLARSGSTVPSPSATDANEASSSSAALSAAVQDIRERQAMEEAQIATHEQSKVESASKYPVKITGMLLFNTFVNTSGVNMAATPALAVPGPGTTGAAVKQTTLGIDATGPHLFGARSFADLRVDFSGNPQSGSSQSGTTTAMYSGYYPAGSTFLRLRTAHAGLLWEHTQAYFSLDRPIFSPDAPSSLIAVAEPALAWSGNLWTWNPQVGVTHDISLTNAHDVRLQAALMDVGDAPGSLITSQSPSGDTSVSAAEQSRWPGIEGRITLLGAGREDDRAHFGIGGYFSPHRTSIGHSFDAWAGTLDARIPLPARLQFSGNLYRGLALGGLGGGAYKDFAWRFEPDSNSYYLRPLDDVGGWTQLQEKFSERLAFNAAFGMDEVFATQLRRYAVPGGTIYQNLLQNRTWTGNVIYSPSAYLVFSLEYRHLESIPVTGLPSDSNVIGLGAGYKF